MRARGRCVGVVVVVVVDEGEEVAVIARRGWAARACSPSFRDLVVVIDRIGKFDGRKVAALEKRMLLQR